MENNPKIVKTEDSNNEWRFSIGSAFTGGYALFKYIDDDKFDYIRTNVPSDLVEILYIIGFGKGENCQKARRYWYEQFTDVEGFEDEDQA